MKSAGLPLLLLFAAALTCSCCLARVSSSSVKGDVLARLHHGGQVRGSVLTSVKGRKFFTFRGIPYAEPPTGERRFTPPVAKSGWSEAINATKDGAACAQIDFHTKTYLGEEDCLFINVYTPELPDDEDDKDDFAVMVFIHGGAFFSGSSSSFFYGPEKLMDKKVILVTFNYRLGPLGFLSTGDSASPGNYGLMDQSLALKWVRDNIAAFGGDAGRVTLFGESAGGASVGYHLLSPMSSGLFKRAIAQSGSPLCIWTSIKNPLHWAKRLATDFGCLSATTSICNTKLVECLRQQPAHELATIAYSYTGVGGVVPVIFTPTVDGKFLTEEPRATIKSGTIPNKVQFLSGINRNEGVMLYAALYGNIPNLRTTDKELVLGEISLVLDDRGKAEEATKLVYDHYFSASGINVSDEKQTRDALIQMYSDGNFDICHYETVHLFAQAGIPTYTYSYDYQGRASFADGAGFKEPLGVSHADELIAQFRIQLPDFSQPTQDDEKASDIINTLWTNFAKVGNPTPSVTDTLPLEWFANSRVDQFNVFHIDLQPSTSTYSIDEEPSYKLWTVDVPAAVARRTTSDRSSSKQEL